MVDKNRLVNEFIELVAIDSITKQERNMADRLIKKLKDLGYNPVEDNTGEIIDGNAGNIICKIEGDKQKDAIMLMAHMDTVEPGIGKKPIIEGDIIKTDGTTILGGDDIGGIVCILEALKIINEQGIEHGDIYVVFTVAEEGGLYGSKNLDYENLPVKYAFVLDDEGAIGTAAVKAPFYNRMEFEITGRASHAGLEPERGISAIVTAAKAIASIDCHGRIDEETTSNIGIIKGGIARNIVCEKVQVIGECRSISPDKLEEYTYKIVNTFKKVCDEENCKISVNVAQEYPGYCIKQDDEIVSVLKNAAQKAGVKLNLHITGGGSDTNIVNSKGIQAVDLSVGMDKVHSTKEQIKISDMEKATTFIVAIMQSV